MPHEKLTDDYVINNVIAWAKHYEKLAKKEYDQLSARILEAEIEQRIDVAVKAERDRLTGDDYAGGFMMEDTYKQVRENNFKELGVRQSKAYEKWQNHVDTVETLERLLTKK